MKTSIYAGFWRRALALILDFFLLISLIYIIDKLIFVQFSLPHPMKNAWVAAHIQFLPFILYFIYAVLWEISPYQATLGKMALGIKTVNMRGERISIWQALGRNAGKILSTMIAFWGFVMASFTGRRQTLHDFLTSTSVVKNEAPIGETLPKEPFRPEWLACSLFCFPVLLWLMWPLVVFMGRTP